VTHDALQKTPPTFRNSTAVWTTAAVPECLQPRHKIVATRRRNSEHRGARLCMAAGRPMAQQSCYSKYAQVVQSGYSTYAQGVQSGYSKYAQGVQSGYSNYAQGVQILAWILWVKAVSIVHTLP
jgi:hypothetical protein